MIRKKVEHLEMDPLLSQPRSIVMKKKKSKIISDLVSIVNAKSFKRLTEQTKKWDKERKIALDGEESALKATVTCEDSAVFAPTSENSLSNTKDSIQKEHKM